MIKEYDIEIFYDKMHWVFCELSKFKKQYKDKQVTIDDSLREQWWDFLINANDRQIIPENIDQVIKEGNEIME